MFQPIQDLGFFGWKQQASDTASISNAAPVSFATTTMADIHQCLDLSAKPPALTTQLRRLPWPIPPPVTPFRVQNRYPGGFPLVVALGVAHQRTNLSKVDFCLGGSVLQVLASRRRHGKTYAVTNVPVVAHDHDEDHHSVIVVENVSDYSADVANSLGHQFERFMTGYEEENVADNDGSITTVEHLQIMHLRKIHDAQAQQDTTSSTHTEKDPIRVLLSAETDARHPTTDALVEIKTSKRRNWGTKTLFQCLASGSTHLIHGDVSKEVETRAAAPGEENGPTEIKRAVTKVTMGSLSQLAHASIRSTQQAHQLQDNIWRGLAEIRQGMQGFPQGTVRMLDWNSSQGQWELLEPSLALHSFDVLPSEGVLGELFATSQ